MKKTKLLVLALSSLTFVACNTIPSSNSESSNVATSSEVASSETSSSEASSETSSVSSSSSESVSSSSSEGVSSSSSEEISSSSSSSSSEQIVLVSSISASNVPTILNATDSVTLQIEVLPSNATNKTVTITSSDSSIIEVNGNELTGINDGMATITITANDDSHVSQTYDITVKTAISRPLSWDNALPMINSSANHFDEISSSSYSSRTETHYTTTNSSRETTREYVYSEDAVSYVGEYLTDDDGVTSATPLAGYKKLEGILITEYVKGRDIYSNSRTTTLYDTEAEASSKIYDNAVLSEMTSLVTSNEFGGEKTYTATQNENLISITYSTVYDSVYAYYTGEVTFVLDTYGYLQEFEYTRTKYQEDRVTIEVLDTITYSVSYGTKVAPSDLNISEDEFYMSDTYTISVDSTRIPSDAAANTVAVGEYIRINNAVDSTRPYAIDNTADYFEIIASDNEEIIKQNGLHWYGQKAGTASLTLRHEETLQETVIAVTVVLPNASSITATSSLGNKLRVGDKTEFEITVNPTAASQEVLVTSSDPTKIAVTHENNKWYGEALDATVEDVTITIVDVNSLVTPVTLSMSVIAVDATKEAYVGTWVSATRYITINENGVGNYNGNGTFNVGSFDTSTKEGTFSEFGGWDQNIFSIIDSGALVIDLSDSYGDMPIVEDTLYKLEDGIWEGEYDGYLNRHFLVNLQFEGTTVTYSNSTSGEMDNSVTYRLSTSRNVTTIEFDTADGGFAFVLKMNANGTMNAVSTYDYTDDYSFTLTKREIAEEAAPLYTGTWTDRNSNIIIIDELGNATYNGTVFTFTYDETTRVGTMSPFGGFDDEDENYFTINEEGTTMSIHISGGYGDNVYNGTFTKQ